MNKNILKHIIRYIVFLAIIVNCVVIFRFSSEESTTSSKTSGRVAGVIIDIFADGKNISQETRTEKINSIQKFVRKTAHFSIYMLLGTLLMICLLTYKCKNLSKASISAILAFLYACTDEFHQTFVAGRSGSFKDVCLDTCGAITGICVVLIIYLIATKLLEKKPNKNTTKVKKKVLFIASTGGHLNELLQLKSLFEKYDYHIVTEKTEVDESLKEEYQDKISFLIYGTKKYPIKYIFKFIANCIKSLYYFFKYQPEVIVTTGTHTAVPICYIAKIFGSKVIFIETFANKTTPTLAGRIVYPIADTFVVQWEELKKCYPKAVCWGWIY